MQSQESTQRVVGAARSGSGQSRIDLQLRSHKSPNVKPQEPTGRDNDVLKAGGKSVAAALGLRSTPQHLQPEAELHALLKQERGVGDADEGKAVRAAVAPLELCQARARFGLH